MTICGSDGVYQSKTTHHVIARKERSEGRGNPLHAMKAFEQCGSLTDSQWIATGFALAMTRCGSDAVYLSRTTHHVIARKERSEGRGNPLYAMDAFEQCDSLPDSQWIATGFQPSR
jgi:5-methylcytosine-specific restriction endonuclease McrA